MARKYNNSKVVVDGITFDSRREAKRYRELSLLLRAGEIRNLELQKRFELVPAQFVSYERYGKRGQRLKDGQRCVELGVTYVADFAYEKRFYVGQGGTHDPIGMREVWRPVVEDTKGVRTEAYIIKRKLMRHVHGICIVEI